MGVEFSDYDYFATFVRRDQRFVPEARLEYAFNKHLRVSASYAYELGVNVLDVPYGSKRDYDRHIVGIGIRATY